MAENYSLGVAAVHTWRVCVSSVFFTPRHTNSTVSERGGRMTKWRRTTLILEDQPDTGQIFNGRKLQPRSSSGSHTTSLCVTSFFHGQTHEFDRGRESGDRMPKWRRTTLILADKPDTGQIFNGSKLQHRSSSGSNLTNLCVMPFFHASTHKFDCEWARGDRMTKWRRTTLILEDKPDTGQTFNGKNLQSRSSSGSPMTSLCVTSFPHAQAHKFDREWARGGRMTKWRCTTLIWKDKPDTGQIFLATILQFLAAGKIGYSSIKSDMKLGPQTHLRAASQS